MSFIRFEKYADIELFMSLQHHYFWQGGCSNRVVQISVQAFKGGAKFQSTAALKPQETIPSIHMQWGKTSVHRIWGEGGKNIHAFRWGGGVSAWGICTTPVRNNDTSVILSRTLRWLTHLTEAYLTSLFERIVKHAQTWQPWCTKQHPIPSISLCISFRYKRKLDQSPSKSPKKKVQKVTSSPAKTSKGVNSPAKTIIGTAIKEELKETSDTKVLLIMWYLYCYWIALRVDL